MLCLSAEAAGLTPAQLSLVQPPYAIANNLTRSPLNTNGLSVLAGHGGSGANGSIAALQYDAHSLYGHAMAAATYRAARVILEQRPFVLSRRAAALLCCAGRCDGLGLRARLPARLPACPPACQPASNLSCPHAPLPSPCRSTYPGTGAFAATWAADNNASWADLQWSVPAVLGAGMAGMPMGEEALRPACCCCRRASLPAA